MKKKIVAIIAVMLVSLMIFSLGARIAKAEDDAASPELKINAKAYILSDFDGKTVIASKNKSERFPIASMVKIMTLDLIFEKLDSGQISLDDSVCVSENAAAMGGSQAFLSANSVYKAEELIKSVIVASANDSCVALAEHCFGNTDEFVSQMNRKAEELGMQNTNFVNCTGLPAENGYSCAEDVAKMTV
ncbi:MAG: D-alanyl-D-alanine carboxypeptidase family protein, partial [Candidatus Neoclostridium sp.]